MRDITYWSIQQERRPDSQANLLMAETGILTPNGRAVCDLCGKLGQPKAVTEQDKEPEHYLPDGWAITRKGNIVLCPNCLAIVSRIYNEKSKR